MLLMIAVSSAQRVGVNLASLYALGWALAATGPTTSRLWGWFPLTALCGAALVLAWIDATQARPRRAVAAFAKTGSQVPWFTNEVLSAVMLGGATVALLDPGWPSRDGSLVFGRRIDAVFRTGDLVGATTGSRPEPAGAGPDVTGVQWPAFDPLRRLPADAEPGAQYIELEQGTAPRGVAAARGATVRLAPTQIRPRTAGREVEFAVGGMTRRWPMPPGKLVVTADGKERRVRGVGFDTPTAGAPAFDLSLALDDDRPSFTAASPDRGLGTRWSQLSLYTAPGQLPSDPASATHPSLATQVQNVFFDGRDLGANEVGRMWAWSEGGKRGAAAAPYALDRYDGEGWLQIVIAAKRTGVEPLDLLGESGIRMGPRMAFERDALTWRARAYRAPEFATFGCEHEWLSASHAATWPVARDINRPRPGPHVASALGVSLFAAATALKYWRGR